MTTARESVGRPSDAALWAGVEHNLREVVLPAVTDDFARMAVVQLVGLARYAIERGEDPTAERTNTLADALDQLAGNSLVDAHWSEGLMRSADTVTEAASAVLVACVGMPAGDPYAVAVRTVLRPILVAQLDEDLAGNSVLLGSFRGKLPDA